MSLEEVEPVERLGAPVARILGVLLILKSSVLAVGLTDMLTIQFMSLQMLSSGEGFWTLVARIFAGHSC